MYWQEAKFRVCKQKLNEQNNCQRSRGHEKVWHQKEKVKLTENIKDDVRGKKDERHWLE